MHDMTCSNLGINLYDLCRNQYLQPTSNLLKQCYMYAAKTTQGIGITCLKCDGKYIGLYRHYVLDGK